MPDPREIELVQRAQSGDESAFRELVEKYQRRVYWLAHNMLNSYERAQDIAQEAFVRVFRNLKRFDTRKNFYTWLYQIVVNLCIDQLRKASHGRTVDLDEVGGIADEGRDPAQAMDRTELRERVQRALDRLPPKYKAVLALRDIQGMTSDEISEIVGCTNATVRWRLHRARKLFKNIWEGKRVEVRGEDEPEASGGR